MTKKIGLFTFAFSLFLTILSTNVVRLKAYSDGIIQPDVPCDPYLGCLVDEYDASTSYPVVLYDQHISAFVGELMHTDYGITHCSSDLYNAGCAVVSMTMVLNYFRGYTTKVVDVKDVNNTVYDSCLYSPGNFKNAYSSEFTVPYINNSYYTVKSQIVGYLAPKINSAQIAIMGVRNGDNLHFVVVKGYIKHYKVWDLDGVQTITSVFTDLIINDSGDTSRTTLTQLMISYPTVYRMHVYLN